MKLNKVPLKNVCDISMGQSPAGEFYNENNEGYPMIAGAGDFCELYPLAKKYTTEANKLSKIDDIILCIRATIGDINWSDKIYCLGRGVAGLTPKKEKLDSHYLWHFLISDKNTLFSKATGSTFKQVSKNHIEEWEIPLPDLPTQTQIAKILDKSTAFIAKRKAQIAELDVLVQSVFLEMFGDPITNPKGWETKKLSEVATYFNGLTYKPENVAENGTIVLRSSNIQNSALAWDDIVRVSIPIKDKLWVKENDILMCSRNGSANLVGKVALIHNIDEEMTFGAFMMIIRSAYHHYLLHFFQTEAFRKQIKTGATTTINQITGAMLDRITLPIPSQDCLEEFSKIIEKIQTQKSQLQESLAELEMQHQALMQRAFRGELV